MRGISKKGSVEIKMTPMMKVKHAKINLEALVDKNQVPPKFYQYLETLTKLLEGEFISACENSQNKIFNKAEQSIEEMPNTEELEDQIKAPNEK